MSLWGPIFSGYRSRLMSVRRELGEIEATLEPLRAPVSADDRSAQSILVLADSLWRVTRILRRIIDSIPAE